MDDILNKLSNSAGLTSEEGQQLKNSFYNILSARLLEVFHNHDQEKLSQLLTMLENEDVDNTQINSFLGEATNDLEIKEAIDQAIEKTLTELTDAVNESSTEEQKQQIIAAL